MPPVLLDWQRISVTKTEQTLTGTGPLGATVGGVWIHSDRIVLQPRALFCSKIRKSKSENVFIAPSEPMIEYPPRGLPLCN